MPFRKFDMRHGEAQLRAPLPEGGRLRAYIGAEEGDMACVPGRTPGTLKP